MSATAESASKRAEANRRNSLRSTGPKSAEAKSRIRLNALKHGLTAETLVLPGEQVELLQVRIRAWKEDLKPESHLEDYLVERIAHVSWQLDRCDRTIAIRLNELVQFGSFDLEEAEADEVEDHGRRLFWDPRGPIALYPHSRSLRLTRISSPDSVDDPLNPARIVNRLEQLAAGCRWLLERWGDLRHLLEAGLKWQAPDRLKAIRLLGRQPMDLLADERVLMIYLACDAMEPAGPTSLDDMRTEANDVELERIKERVKGRGADWKKPADPEAGKAALLALIERATSRLEAKLSVHRQHQEFEKAVQMDLLAFDDSAQGELMRRYHLAKGRELNRLLATYFKVQREARQQGDDAEAPPVSQEPIPVAGPESFGWVQSTDTSPIEPEMMPVGCAQPTDASQGEAVGCAEPSPAPPALREPILDRLPGDETSPIPAAGPNDETKPIPAQPPISTAEEPAQPDFLAAIMARLDPSQRLSLMFHQAISEPQRRSPA
jgi:hypothetical protein